MPGELDSEVMKTIAAEVAAEAWQEVAAKGITPDDMYRAGYRVGYQHGGGHGLLADIVAAPPDAEYLLWSGKRGMWWAPKAAGYVDNIEAAGLYPATQALRYVLRSADSGDKDAVTRMVRPPHRAAPSAPAADQ